MTPFDFHRQNYVVEPIGRRIFTSRRDTVLGAFVACAIGAGLALVLVAWWSA